VRLQRLPLAELLTAPVAAEPTGGALAGAVLGAGFVAGRAVAVPVHDGAVPLEQHVRGPRRRAAHAAAPHGAAVRQAVSSGSGPRGARRAWAERADERRHDAAVGVVRGPAAGAGPGPDPDGRQPPAAGAEAGDLELAAGVGAEHDLVRDGVEELAAADRPRAAAAGRLPRVALAPVDHVAEVGDGARATRPRGALGHDRRQVGAADGRASAPAGDGTGLGARDVDLRRLGAAVQRPLEREPHRRRRRLPRRRRGLVLLGPRRRSTTAATPEGSSARAPPPLAHRVRS